jgi:uncharacterized SAM-binding protein YcdF (DUF218 family)
LKIKFRHPIVLAVAFLATLASAAWLTGTGADELRSEIHGNAAKKLVHLRPIPPGLRADVVYVLGGNERSLQFKYQAAAEALRNGAVAKIWILGRPGLTEYRREIGRNLTNDEWSIDQLKKLGVPAESIEIVNVSGGFFGTLAEARQVSELVRTRGIKSLLLIAQPYHTRRAYISFKRYLPDAVTLYTQRSNETQRLHQAFIELIKFEVYRNWLVSVPAR